jgi:hypothetical protein
LHQTRARGADFFFFFFLDIIIAFHTRLFMFAFENYSLIVSSVIVTSCVMRIRTISSISKRANLRFDIRLSRPSSGRGSLSRISIRCIFHILMAGASNEPRMWGL